MQRFSETLLKITLGGGSDYCITSITPIIGGNTEKDGRDIHTLNEIRNFDPSIRAMK
jgi:hypothetical protein